MPSPGRTVALAARRGEPVHFMGLGPHTLRIGGRPDWMFSRERYGGVLNDIASHQVAQFGYWMMQDPIPQFSRVGNHLLLSYRTRGERLGPTPDRPPSR